MARGGGKGYGTGFLQQWDNGPSAPNAPAGMQQIATAQQGYESGKGGYGTSFLGEYQSTAGSYAESAQSWYTGANQQGVENGWNNDFYDRMYKQNQQLGESGDLGRQFTDAAELKTTGVVTWDHEGENGEMFKFGDIYDRGKHVGNIYDQFKGDQQTADLMMSQIVLDDDTKRAVFGSGPISAKLFMGGGDVAERLSSEIQRVRETNNTEIPKALAAADFNTEVQKEADEIAEGGSGDLITALGALGGGLATGGAAAAIAAPFGGLPAVPAFIGGFAVGALGGGIGAEMNKDALSEQAARAELITKMSYQENGKAAGLSTGVAQWGGFTGRLFAPQSNLVQGIEDAARGEVGDGEAEFFRTDSHGDPTRSRWARWADLGATVSDSLVQFASPLGFWAYTAQMSSVIGGEVGELAFSGGKQFDYSRGGFDNIFTDDDGTFDATQAAAGIGKIGIDVVQLGMARGLAGRSDAAAAEVGATGARYGTGVLRDRMPTWLGGVTAEQRAAVAAGGRPVEAQGFRFILSKEGAVVGNKVPTLSLLAPSEQLGALSAFILKKRGQAVTKGAAPADEFYRAAHGLATGERKLTTAIVNGMGEGYEEGMQTVFEAHSHGNRIDGEEIWNAALYGGAAGIGMGLAFNTAMPSGDSRMRAMAQVNDPSLTKDEWETLSETERRTRAATTPAQRKVMEASYRKIVADHGRKYAASVAGVEKWRDAVATTMTAVNNAQTYRTDAVFTITQVEHAGDTDADGNITPGSIPNDGIAMAGEQLLWNSQNHMRGMLIAQERYNEELAALAKIDAPTEQQTARIAEVTRLRDLAEEVQAMGALFSEELDEHIARLYAANRDLVSIEADATALNVLMRDLFNRRRTVFRGVTLSEEQRLSMARAVSHVYTRDPQDQSGSYQVLVPQVSAALTWANTNGVAQISHALLAPLGADYDGDKVRQQAQLILDDKEYESARSGAYLLGAGASVNIATPTYETYIVEQMSAALEGDNETLQAYAQDTMLSITERIKARFSGIVDDDVLDETAANFHRRIHAGSPAARQALIDGLAADAGGPLSEHSRENLSNEWLWIDQLVRSTMQQFQRAYVEHRPKDPTGPGKPDTTDVAPHKRDRKVRERRAARMATLGLEMGVVLPGDSLFRKFQKLHFSSLLTTAKKALTSARERGERADLAEMAQIIEAIGSGLTTSEIEAVRGRDRITSTVFAQLQRLSESSAADLNARLGEKLQGRPFTSSEALPVLANIAVAEMKVDDQGRVLPIATGRTISLAQMLLKREVVKDKNRNQLLLEVSPDLAARYKHFDRLVKPQSDKFPHGAEEAFFEIIEAQQLYTLLGDDALIFGPQLTVGQYARGYISMSEGDRYNEDRRLKDENSLYLGRKESKNLPYGLSEVDKGQISPYRAVVDTLLAVGHNSITISEKGVLSGEKAERSDYTSEMFRAMHTDLRKALKTYVDLAGGKGQKAVKKVRRLMENNKDVDRVFLDLIPDGIVNAVYEQRDDGTLHIANWVYEMLVIKDPKKAEMHYFRSVRMAQWFAKGADPKAEGKDDPQKAREYHRLDYRIHQIMWNLANQPDGGIMYQLFIKKMMEADDLEKFFLWVNTTPGIRGNQAPLTPWVDDVAEFAKDRAGGGWTTKYEGAELREAIGIARKSAENLMKDLGSERDAWKDDVQILDAIDQGDENYRKQAQRVIDNAEVMFEGVGPQSMINQTATAAWGIYAQAHNKGRAAAHVKLAGQVDAIRDAMGFLTDYERTQAALTTRNMEDVSGSIGQVAKGAGQTMDDKGRVVKWKKFTVDEFSALLRNPDTRAAARAVFWPTMVEETPSGQMSRQFLFDTSLSTMLSGASYDAMFANWETKPTQDQALRYTALADALTRQYGGHFAVQRLADEIVIAELSAADSTLTIEDVEAMTVEVYEMIARLGQAVGGMAANFQDPHDHPLNRIRERVMKAQAKAHLKDRLGVDAVKDKAIDKILKDRETEMTKQAVIHRKKSQEPGISPSERDRQREIQRDIEADIEDLQRRAEILRSDNPTQRAVEMFHLPADPQERLVKQEWLVNYILMRPGRFMQAGRGTDEVVRKLFGQLGDKGRFGDVDLRSGPDPTDLDGPTKDVPDEWGQLSRAAISIYLDEAMSLSPDDVQVPAYPDESTALGRHQARYFDTTFSYLSEAFLDPKHPVTQAFARIHNLAQRGPEQRDEGEIYRLFADTLYKENRFGSWTSDIPRTSIDAGERFDSASSEPGVAQPGISPRRQAVHSAAEQRTYKMPDLQTDPATGKTFRDWSPYLSESTLNWDDLHAGSPWDEVEVLFPTSAAGTRAVVRRPLAQLNNRFAASVRMTYVDANGVPDDRDLLAEDPNVGWLWEASDQAVESGLQAISVDRIKKAVDKFAADNAIPVTGISVQVAYLHPDTQPSPTDVAATPEEMKANEWIGNHWFEGTAFRLNADRHDSLNSTLWFANGSINPATQTRALSASKKGKIARAVYPMPTDAERQALDDQALTDLAKVLREKTKIMFSSDHGADFDIEMYNAIHKSLKMRHYVRGTVPGTDEVVIWSAEQVIAWQRENPGVALPFDNADLWMPSDRVLRTALGEQGREGLSRVFPDQLEVELTNVDLYQGPTAKWVELFGEGLRGETLPLFKTDVVHRGRTSRLVVRPYMSVKFREAFKVLNEYWSEQRQEISIARSMLGPSRDKSEFNTQTNMDMAVKFAGDALNEENISIDFPSLVGWIAPRDTKNLARAKSVVNRVAAIKKSEGYTNGFVYQEGGPSNLAQGYMNHVAIDKPLKEKAYRVMRGDLVVVDVESFRGDMDQARKRLEFFADRGATIVLAANYGASDQRAELGSFLDAHIAYTRIRGTDHVFEPDTLTSRYQNLRARESAMVAVRGVSPRNHLATLLVDGWDITENAGWVNADNPRLKDVAIQMDLLPVDFLAGYGVATDTLEDDSQVSEVRARVLALNHPTGREMLFQMTIQEEKNGKVQSIFEGDSRKDELEQQAREEFDLHFKRLVKRLKKEKSSVLPQPGSKFGTGDFIPLIDNRGDILLYRHGYVAPHRDEVNRMAATALPGEQDAAGFSMFLARREKDASTHYGTVTSIPARKGFGLSLELMIDLDVYGGKFILEWNGMKYVMTPKPDRMKLPKTGFFPNWGIDVIASLADARAKESLGGVVENFQSAFAYFGVDFLPDVAKFFGVDPSAARSILGTIAHQRTPISITKADELLNTRYLYDYARAALQSTKWKKGQKPPKTDWVESLNDETVEAQITKAIIIYLMTPGARVEHVLSSGGFNDESSDIDNQSRLMPPLFTQVFDNAKVGSPLRKEMFKRINTQLHNPNADVNGEGYSMSQVWDFTVHLGTGATDEMGPSITGRLQFAEVFQASENPVKNVQSFDHRDKQAFRPHSAAMSWQATGGETVYKYDIAKVRNFATGAGIPRFTEKDATDGGVWRSLSRIDPKSRGASAAFRVESPIEHGRRKLARSAMVLYRQKIKRKPDWGWEPDNVLRYESLADDIMLELGLDTKQRALVDYWVRQRLGAPKGAERTNQRDEISFDEAFEAATAIYDLVSPDAAGGNRYLPTLGGMVPLMHVNDLQLIYRANRDKGDKGWRPTESMDDGGQAADGWNAWVRTSLGSAILSDDLFDPIYLLATDGFMHSYQSATRSLLDLPVSMDRRVTEAMLDPDTNMHLVSVNPNVQYAATNTLILDFNKAGLGHLIWGNDQVTSMKNGVVLHAPSSAVAEKLDRLKGWRKKNRVPMPVDTTSRNFRHNGDLFVDEGTHDNALIRWLIHLRVGTAMINPALYVSMGPEQWVRGTLDRISNLATLQSIAAGENRKGQATGVAGRLARAGHLISGTPAERTREKIQQLETQYGRTPRDDVAERKKIQERIQRLQAAQEKYQQERLDLIAQREASTDDKEQAQIQRQLDRMGMRAVFEAMGFTYRYTPNLLVKMNRLATSLGDRNDFKAMIYRDIMYLKPYGVDISKIEGALAFYAKLGSKMQDPTWGMRGKTLARRYMEGALQHINHNPLQGTLTAEALTSALATDPEFLQKHWREAHLAGAANVAQIRSLKNTTANHLVRGFIDPATESSHSGVKMFANLFGRIPLLFSGYGTNVATTILGLQGVDAAIAAVFHGKKKGRMIGGIQKALKGENWKAEDGIYDFEDVLDGIDLTRAFIRGGITHMSLFQLGMLAGGLGLSGEDDETKKRRKLAEAQGAGFIYDARKVENDFRNADAIYLDWLPWHLDTLFQATPGDDGRSMGHLHWMVKQFISPMIGMEKFFETGDWRQVAWGFEDAIGSFPLINSMAYSDAVSTANALAEMANDEQKMGTPENDVAAMALLTNAVGVYERMLFENAFFNAIYVGRDRYDRDPYKLPLRDSDGVIQKDIENQPRPNDLALETYIDPETGEIGVGYMTRDSASATLHALTENRWSLATGLTLFSGLTGIDNTDWYRTQMPIKIRKQELPPMTEADVMGVVRAISEGYVKSGAQEPLPNLSSDEISQQMKDYYKAKGIWVDWGDIDATAIELAKQQPPAALSYLDKDGREHVTNEGARNILRSLSRGTIQIGDPGMAGVYITKEMRESIQETWMHELVQEGIDMGLDQSKATSRMNRLWYGPKDDPAYQGLGDILWNKDIGWFDTLEYNQLNTTFVEGPDGRPWATAYKRDGFFGALGLKPIGGMLKAEQSSVGADSLLNTVNLVNQTNTGLRALELIDQTRYIPTDVEIGKSIEAAIADAANDAYTPFTPYGTSGGSGYGGYGGYGYSRRGYGGGGGGYSSSGSSFYPKMYAFPESRTPYANDIPFINTTNPLIRRGDIRRERVWSERGRLKQWQ